MPLNKDSNHWPGLLEDVKRFVLECNVCRRNKCENVPYSGLLQPLPILSKAWEHISIDFVEGLPKSNVKVGIFFIVDRFTNYAHFIALSHPYTTSQVAQIFLDNTYKLHGTQSQLCSIEIRHLQVYFGKNYSKGLEYK